MYIQFVVSVKSMVQKLLPELGVCFRGLGEFLTTFSFAGDIRYETNVIIFKMSKYHTNRVKEKVYTRDYGFLHSMAVNVVFVAYCYYIFV